MNDKQNNCAFQTCPIGQDSGGTQSRVAGPLHPDPDPGHIGEITSLDYIDNIRHRYCQNTDWFIAWIQVADSD